MFRRVGHTCRSVIALIEVGDGKNTSAPNVRGLVRGWQAALVPGKDEFGKDRTIA